MSYYLPFSDDKQSSRYMAAVPRVALVDLASVLIMRNVFLVVTVSLDLSVERKINIRTYQLTVLQNKGNH